MDSIFDGFGDFYLLRLVGFVLQVDSEVQVGSHRQHQVVAADAEVSDRVGRLELDALLAEERLT